MSELAFPPQGSRAHLERLAAGQGTPDDVVSIGEIMDRSADQIEASIETLRQYSGLIREKVGMKATNLLGEILYGPVGKRQLRNVLHELAQNGATIDGIHERVPELARLALGHIEQLNLQLAELHDLVLGLREK